MLAAGICFETVPPMKLPTATPAAMAKAMRQSSIPFHVLPAVATIATGSWMTWASPMASTTGADIQIRTGIRINGPPVPLNADNAPVTAPMTISRGAVGSKEVALVAVDAASNSRAADRIVRIAIKIFSANSLTCTSRKVPAGFPVSPL